MMKTVLAPAFKARMLGLAGWYSTNILGNRDGEVLDDPESFKTKEESKLGVLEYILQPDQYPELYGNVFHKVRINYYPPRGDNKEGWDNIDIFGWLGYPMQIKVDFLCRDSILAAPIVLDLALFFDLAQRARLSGIQEWLSFYFKSPQTAPGLYPEHDLFIQQTKLKNTDRKSTRLNSSHSQISYAVFCLKKNKSSIYGYANIVPFVFFALFHFYYMVITSLKNDTELYNLKAVPFLIHTGVITDKYHYLCY